VSGPVRDNLRGELSGWVVAAFAVVCAAAGVVEVDRSDATAVIGACEPACDSAEAAAAPGPVSVPTPLATMPAAPLPKVPEAVPAPSLPAPSLPAPPVWIAIPGIEILAPVDPVGLLAGGGLAVPVDIARVGWFAPEGFALAPGEPGTAVLAGHRDSRQDGAGALRHLEELTAGEEIVVVHADGGLSHWRVQQVVLTPRAQLPGDELFARSGAPRLALVTCGGSFDRALRRYTHNVIVYAEPAAPEPGPSLGSTLAWRVGADPALS